MPATCIIMHFSLYVKVNGQKKTVFVDISLTNGAKKLIKVNKIIGREKGHKFVTVNLMSFYDMGGGDIYLNYYYCLH